MSKGRSIGPIKGLIFETFEKMKTTDSKVTSKQVAEAVREAISDPKWPSNSTVANLITKWTTRETPDDKDLLWSIMSLAEYPIPPEALPTVLHVFAFTLEEGLSPLTIREALWVARLSSFYINGEMTPSRLYFAATVYASMEKSHSISMGEYPKNRDEMLFFWREDLGNYLTIPNANHKVLEQIQDEISSKMKSTKR